MWWSFNDQFITRSLLSPRVKKFWKSVNICQNYGQLSRGSFFMKHGVLWLVTLTELKDASNMWNYLSVSFALLILSTCIINCTQKLIPYYEIKRTMCYLNNELTYLRTYLNYHQKDEKLSKLTFTIKVTDRLLQLQQNFGSPTPVW